MINMFLSYTSEEKNIMQPTLMCVCVCVCVCMCVLMEQEEEE